MTNEVNPYTPPASTGEGLVHHPEDHLGFSLATRGSRFVAVMIDGIIMMSIIMPLMFSFGVIEAIQAGTHAIGPQLMWAALSFAVWLLVNGYFLHTRGQSLGKMVMKIQIVRNDNSRADLFHLAILRMLPTQIVVLIPTVGQLLSLVDVLFIFSAEKRCIHDLIADTRVVKLKR